MVDIQSHRGPDADGFLVDGPLAMGMRRLSIIDLAGGDQPIFNEDRSLAVIMNGELFNYIELREWLIAQRPRFVDQERHRNPRPSVRRARSGLLPKLNGMFAFALWNRKSRSLLLARDRMGVKPLYYARVGSRWLFASELKSLLTHGRRHSVRPRSSCRFSPPWLHPARSHAISRRSQAASGPLSLHPRRSRRRARLVGFSAITAGPSNEESLPPAKPVDRRFDDAVKSACAATFPWPLFSAAALDSSLITLTAQAESSAPMRTFALGFEHSEFNELPYASSVARRAGTEHTELLASVQNAIEKLPLLLWHMDSPWATPPSFPTISSAAWLPNM